MKKCISIVCPCYNEEENINRIYVEIKSIMKTKLPNFEYEVIFIDNCSEDRTRPIIRELCKQDPRVKAIFNVRNFGHIRSPYYGITQAYGDAVILMASDLQDPPSLIVDFVNKWMNGSKIIIGVKNKSKENFIMYRIRTFYYKLIKRISDVEQIEHFTGFGLYDRSFVDILRDLKDPYPYFRGIIAELGYKYDTVFYTQPRREHGKTKNNFYTLYDMAMLGITSYSKVPLRIVTMLGFFMSILSLLVSLTYLILKIFFWNAFPMGIAPIMIGMFFLGSVQLFVMGILGEYILNINTRVLNRPIVIEEERINFHPNKVDKIKTKEISADIDKKME